MAEYVLVYDKTTGLYKAQLIGTSLIASGAITAEKIYDGDPFTLQQTSAPQMRHVPYGSDYGAGPTYHPVHVDASGYQYFAGVWPDNTGTSSKIVAGAVGTPHIAAEAILSGQLGSGQVGIPHIYPGAITSAKIGLLAVGTPHIADEAVTSAKLASGAGGAPLADGAVTSAKLASGAIGGVHIKDGSIPGGDLANQAITSAKIGTLAVGTPHIAANAIISGKIASGAFTWG